MFLNPSSQPPTDSNRVFGQSQQEPVARWDSSGARRARRSRRRIFPSDATSAADINFLSYLAKLVPFKVAKKGESHPIAWLTKYPPGREPPNIYMTDEIIRAKNSN